MTASIIRVRGATKRYGRRIAVDAVDLEIHPGRITALLGPSGCGKSTLLRMIAGLETLDGGFIHAGERLWADAGRAVPPEHRGVGLVFQDQALFPHLTALQNVGFGLSGMRRDAREARARTFLERVRLGDRADAWPYTLSGGEQQRVALARALAIAPRAVLLDEPFSGLDSHLKAEVRETLLAALRDSDAAVLLVTHDAGEALLMADDLVLMNAGRVLQAGSPHDCYFNPVSPAAARLLGEADSLPAIVQRGAARTAFGSVPAPGRADGPAVVMVRPEGVVLDPAGSGATVSRAGFGGGFHELTLKADDQTVRLRTRKGGHSSGDRVHVRLDPTLSRVFDALY